jgi:hypothetical protein
MPKRAKTRKQLAQEVAAELRLPLGDQVYKETESSAWAITPELRIVVNNETRSKPWAAIETGPLDRPLYLRFFGWFKGFPAVVNTDAAGNPIVM